MKSHLWYFLWVISLHLFQWVSMFTCVSSCMFVREQWLNVRWDFGQGFRIVAQSLTTFSWCGFPNEGNPDSDGFFVHMPCSVIYHYMSSLFLCFAFKQRNSVLLSDQNVRCPAKPHFIPECNQSGVPFPLCGIFLSLSLQCNHVTSSFPSKQSERMCNNVFLLSDFLPC